MAERKIISTDFTRQKQKVKAEMLRRCYRGSVVSYGSSSYDYSVAPTATGPIMGEHIKKNLTTHASRKPQWITIVSWTYYTSPI